jgi:hypothetical protein
MSEQANITPQEPVKAEQKTVAADELSEEALDQVAGGPASTPSMTVKKTATMTIEEQQAINWAQEHPSGVTGQIASSPKTP